LAVALLVAAGRGERLGAPGPKAFVTLAGRPMLEWSLDALRAAPSVERVVIAVPPGVSWAGGGEVVEGGEARSQSVRNALAAAGDAEIVLVHDAARPLLDAGLVERCLAALDGGADAVVAAAPVTDTVKEAADGIVVRTLDRTRLWSVQTPQVFRRAVLEDALAQPADVLAAATDDAGLVEARGGVVRVVESTARNLKVTTATHLKLAELLLGDTADAAFAAIAQRLLREPGVEGGTGFGKNPGLRAGGKIFAMLVRGELVVKLPAQRSAALVEGPAARTFTVGQRSMREWVSIEHGGPHDWAALAGEALVFVRSP
jgi:2-C-methyl-D-erythritol 4-phosphate cytidylyltransferase